MKLQGKSPLQNLRWLKRVAARRLGLHVNLKQRRQAVVVSAPPTSPTNRLRTPRRKDHVAKCSNYSLPLAVRASATFFYEYVEPRRSNGGTRATKRKQSFGLQPKPRSSSLFMIATRVVA
jgi:hypothetical protein